MSWRNSRHNYKTYWRNDLLDRVHNQAVLWFKDRIVVPKNAELRQQILDEAHLS